MKNSGVLVANTPKRGLRFRCDPALVDAIREDFQTSDATRVELYDKYMDDGVSYWTVKRIVQGYPKPKEFRLRGPRAPRARLDWEDVATIRKLYASGRVKISRIAERFGVSRSLISKIAHNHIWNE
jgi:hypothetical protein